MTQRKSERIMNLTICLLMARYFISREQIRHAVDGYANLTDGAFERMFERDKDDLRAMGVPVETGSNSVLFPDDVGYRIRRTDFELPPLEFDAAETAVLGLASDVWDQARLAGATVKALAKLRAAGLDPDASRVAGFAPTMGAREPAFEPLWQATITRTPVAFRHSGVARVVEPWTMTYRRGAWYFVGFDRVRGEGRSYRISRIEDVPAAAGEAGDYPLPDAATIEAHLASLEPRGREATALIAVRDGAAGDQLRDAEPAGTPSPRAGYATWRVPVGPGAPGELSSYGVDVLVLAPPALVDAVVAQLREVASWR